MPILEKLCSEKEIQIVILGSSHPQDPTGRQYAATMRNLSHLHRSSLFLVEGFETDLSHLIYAAADFFLMPSVYEPCGLAQMISMRYGTLPIVRFVGGLADTVSDEQAGAMGNGFGFKEAVVDSMPLPIFLRPPKCFSKRFVAPSTCLKTTRNAGSNSSGTQWPKIFLGRACRSVFENL